MQNAAAAAADREVREAAELYGRGDRVAAEGLCRRILTGAPWHRDARLLLGIVLLSQARYDEAETVFDDLAAVEPAEQSHWINLGTARHGAKRLDAALTAFSRAAALGANSADFYYNVGLTHIDRFDFEAARAVFARAVALAPGDAELRYRYAQSCFEARRPEDALAALEGWQSLTGLTTEVAASVGYLLMDLGESAQAELAFERVMRDPTPDPHVALIVIDALERINRLADARLWLDRLIADPRSQSLGSDLLRTQAQLAERGSQPEIARDCRERALLEVKELPLRHFQLFRLAKNLDSLKRYEEAFEALREAHRSQAAYFALTAPAVTLRGVPTMTVTKYGCDPADVATWDHRGAPSMDESPIFIVAFPRSGTTLLELTLDAHPLLRSMDEQPFLQGALHDLGATGIQYPEQLGRLTDGQLDAVRAAYWQRVQGKVRLEPGQRLVDKNPLNILRLPVIRRLFPNARTLLAVRHPCDVLLSCYMQHFRSPDFALLCGTLGTLATGYLRTMDYWYQQLALLGAATHEVRYETFVAQIEPEMRRACEFLQLPWDDRVLAPAANAQAKGYISTPSYAQVVQPVSQKAVGKWRPYQAHFTEVVAMLRPYFERWNYAG